MGEGSHYVGVADGLLERNSPQNLILFPLIFGNIRGDYLRYRASPHGYKVVNHSLGVLLGYEYLDVHDGLHPSGGGALEGVEEDVIGAHLDHYVRSFRFCEPPSIQSDPCVQKGLSGERASL